MPADCSTGAAVGLPSAVAGSPRDGGVKEVPRLGMALATPAHRRQGHSAAGRQPVSQTDFGVESTDAWTRQLSPVANMLRRAS
jgi:hypothetical protein